MACRLQQLGLLVLLLQCLGGGTSEDQNGQDGVVKMSRTDGNHHHHHHDHKIPPDLDDGGWLVL